MVANIVPASSFNPASLTADGLYISIQNPPGFLQGVPTDVLGLVGTGSWGPVNTAVHMGSPFDALQAFGPIGAAALTDPYDIATDLAIAFGQANAGGTLEAWGVRVTDGTDTNATAAIAGAPTSASETVTVGGTIMNGDSVTLTITCSAITGSPVAIVVPVVTADTLTTIAAKLVAAINGNAALKAAGLFASNVGALASVYQPTTLSPQATFAHTDGADATFTLGTGAASTSGLTLSGLFTGSLANGASGINVTIQTGAAANTFQALISFPTLGVQELFTNLPSAGFFAALASAINNGVSGVRGPSGVVKAAGPANIAVGAPSLATVTMSGGTDGRAGVVTATLLGSDSAVPKTGIYALRAVNPQVGIVWIVGTTDPTVAPLLVAFNQTQGCSAFEPFPVGTSTATAIGLVGSQGVHDPSFAYAKDWIYWFDPVNNVQRLVSPVAFMAGTIGTLTPNSSPSNKPVLLVNGTERNNPVSGDVPYSLSEIGQLETAGVMFITNPIPAGSIFGMRHGQTTSLNPATAGFEWWRLGSFLARTFGTTLGQFVGQQQSQRPNDPVRNAVQSQLNQFLNSLVGANGAVGLIDSFSVICSFNASNTATPGNGVNTPSSIAAGYLYVLVRVTYLSTIRFFVLSLQGGTTVVSVGATPGQQLNN